MKTKFSTKALSLFLSVLMVFTCVSVGIIAPDFSVDANAATVGQTYTVNSIDELENAIDSANTVGNTVITTIKLGQTISHTGALGKFPTITGNIVFDFNGYSLLMTYTESGNYSSGQTHIQLPSENTGYHNGEDTLANAMFTVYSGATLQIINTKSGNISSMQVYTELADDKKEESVGHQTSSSLIRSAGTLIIGDKNTAYNEFTLYAHSLCRITNGDNPNLYGEKHATANVNTVTVDGANAVYKQYGGTVQATGAARARRGSYADILCHALNLQQAYSAEIYGGSVNVPKCPNEQDNGIFQVSDTASDGGTARISAIRCNTPNLYIFDVDCHAQAKSGADSSNGNTVYLSAIWSTDAANVVNLYGGNIDISWIRGKNMSVATMDYAVVRGNYRYAESGKLSSTTTRSNIGTGSLSAPGLFDNKDEKSGSGNVVLFTAFIGDNSEAENGLDMFSFATFRAYLNAYNAESDKYYGNSVMSTHINDGTSYGPGGSVDYLRNGYTQVGWLGKIHPGTTYLESGNTTGGAGLSSTVGGSLYLAPKWEENVYTINYDDLNDSTGANKATLTDSCPTTYSITSNKTFGTPTRPGYEFVNWEVYEIDYPPTDTKTRVWDLATYPAGFSLNGKNGNLKLKAHWQEVSYTATFDLDGGNISGNDANVTSKYTVNTNFRFPPTVSKDFYTFDGTYKCIVGDGYWTVNNTLYAADDTSAYGAWGNPTFQAQFTPIEYNVTYDSNNGSSVDDSSLYFYNIENVYDGEYTNKSLPRITRVGYDFVGWRPLTSSGSWSAATTYPAGTTFEGMNGNVDLRAIWESATYTLTLQLDETESISGPTSFNYSYSSALELNNPTKTGYKFAGWEVVAAPDSGTNWVIGKVYTPDIEGAKVSIPANGIGNVTLAPVWTPVTYTIMYNANGGVACEPFEYTIEDTVTLPTTTKNGYTFTHWSVSENEGNWIDTSYSAGQNLSGMYGDVSLLANWTKTGYTVTLDLDGGELGTTTLSYNIEAITNLQAPTKTGYNFDGWKVTSIDPSASWEMGTVYKDALPAGNWGNLTLKALWSHKEFNIHFVSSGTTPTDRTYYIDSEPFNVPASSYPGFTFNNWTVVNAVGNWEKNEVVTTETLISGKYGDVTLSANFTANEYTITYNHYDGHVETDTYTMLDTIDVPPCSVAGYTFNGWKVASVENGGGWSVGKFIAPGQLTAGAYYGDVVLEPVLVATEFEIVFLPDGGTPYPNLTYTVESEDELPVPEKTGYDFAGWSVVSAAGNWTENETVTGKVTGRYGTVTLKALWTPKKYTITWITGSGTQTTQAEFGTIPSYDTVNTAKPADAEFTYTFTGWNVEPSAVTGEATYEAQYSKTKNSYTVTWKYEVDETSGVKTETAVYEYGIHPVFNGGVNPVKQSSNEEDHVFRFDGWIKEGTNEPLTESTVVTGNVTYVATYVTLDAPVTVTWIINGVSQETKWQEGDDPVYVGTPIKPDENGYEYTFTDWNPAVHAVVKGGDNTYVAQFKATPKKYTATFNLLGGVSDAATTVEYTVNGLTMLKPTKDGYDFAGWMLVSDAGNWITRPGGFTSDIYTGKWGNVEFNAVWTPKEYTVTVEKEDGSTDTFKYTIESDLTLPDAEKLGFEHTAWTIVSGGGSWLPGDTVEKNKSLKGMFGDVTVHPVFTAKLYTIYWVSGDITQSAQFKYGEAVIAYPPIQKAGYTANWDNEVPNIMPAEDLTFTAQYSPIQYYLRFNTAGGSEVENFYYDTTSETVLPTPTRDGANFKHWKVSVGQGSWVRDMTVAGGTSLKGTYGNATLTAVWEIDIKTVTWVAGDVTKVTKWYFGSMPSFDGTPFKSPDGYNSYVFTGWDKEIKEVTEDVTYTAQFRAIERLYTVIWNVDNVITTETYTYGETPVFGGETPMRPSTSEYDFTFAGWSPDVDVVTGDITYIAQFDVFTKLLALRIDKTSVFLDVGDNAVLTAILSPSTASSKDVKWISANESIATIDDMGKVTAVAPGDVVVRVESIDGQFKSYCLISVSPIANEYIVISAGGLSTTRLPGEAIQLTATVMPENSTNKNVQWSSSDTTVAIVDPVSGLVQFGNVIGTATITAVADGYAVGSIEVKTTEDKSEVEDNVKTYMVMYTGTTCEFIIAGNVYENINIVYPEGTDVEFLLTEPHFAVANGVAMQRDPDGVFRISAIDKNYSILTSTRIDLGIQDDDDVNEAPSIMDRIQAFFRRIVEFFRNLFK